MKVFQCDFCRETKPCTQTVIDSRSYDMCAVCREARDKNLDGRGEQAAPTLLFPIVQPFVVNPYYVPYPIYVPLHEPVSPTITCEWSSKRADIC